MMRRTQLTGRILIVEDEPGVQKFLSRLIGTTGADVETASTGKEALDAIQRGDILLAVLDMNLPDANGLDLLREIRRIYPTARVILSSGYSESEVPSGLLQDPQIRFLQKPYQIATFWQVFDSLFPD